MICIAVPVVYHLWQPRLHGARAAGRPRPQRQGRHLGPRRGPVGGRLDIERGLVGAEGGAQVRARNGEREGSGSGGEEGRIGQTDRQTDRDERTKDGC